MLLAFGTLKLQMSRQNVGDHSSLFTGQDAQEEHNLLTSLYLYYKFAVHLGVSVLLV